MKIVLTIVSLIIGYFIIQDISSASDLFTNLNNIQTLGDGVIELVKAFSLSTLLLTIWVAEGVRGIFRIGDLLEE